MAISDKITSIQNHLKNDWDSVESLIGDTELDKNIENISSALDDLYNDLPKVTGSGTSITLDDTRVGKIKSTLKGNTSQTGTPTPSSPIPVNVVSGDNKINVCGKNLYNANDTTYYQACTYVSGANTNQYKVKATGTDIIINSQLSSGTSYSSIAGTLIPCKYGETIYYDTGNSNFTKNIVTQYNSNKVSLGYSALNVGSSSGSYTPTNSDCEYISIRIGYGSATSGTEYTLAPIVSKISNLTYKPYQSNTYNIDLPVENLFDKSNANKLDCLLNGTNGSIANYNGAKSLYIPIQSSKTYTISKVLSARFVVGTCVSTPANGVTCSVYSANNTGTSITITSGANDKFLCVFYYLSGTDTLTEQQILDSIQIETGSKANSYTPYGTTPIELCKIGNYKDYFYKDSGKWYLHKEIGKVVFNGSETWYKSASYPGNYYCQNAVPNGITHDINCFSNLTSVFWAYLGQLASDDNGIMLEGGSDLKTIDFKISSISTLDDFKSFLGNTNLILYYVYATPTNTEITYQPLIDQLNELEKAMSYDTQTNISQVNNDLPFIISASALKEWQENTSLNSTLSMVNPLSLGNTLNTQEIENNTQPIEVDNIEPLEEEENEES